MMRIERVRIGTTIGHVGQGPTAVDAYTLDSGRGFAIVVWTYGASLVEVRVPDRDGRVGNVVLRLPDLPRYEDRGTNPSYFGATCGRYARCIAGGQFTLDGREHRVVCNYGRHHFHGGPLGFDTYVWDADARRDDDTLAVHLRLERPDGDQGYPGAIAAESVYRLDPSGRVSFEHRATATASTVVDLTNHSYWNLAASGAVNDHTLAINAARVLLVDDELIPIGAPVSAAAAGLDYRAARPIAATRLDHCFALDEQSWAAELYDPHSGRVMRVVTDQPGLQVYSGDGLAAPRAGLCVQTGSWPNAPNRADYPSARLNPGDTYRHRTTHVFTVR